MTNPFEKHGISYLSPSSANTFAAQPALWVMERLIGKKGFVGCAAHRGTAIEHGVAAGLLDLNKPIEECQAEASARYEELAFLSGDPRKEKHRASVMPAVAVALAELRQYGTPNLVQTKVVHEFEELPVPILGYLDFGWTNHGIVVDLKTQDRLASEISAPHGRQGALYVHNTNSEMRFAYTTPQKIGVYRLDDPPAHMRALLNICIRMGKFLALSADAAELAALVVPDYGSFYWNDPTTRAYGREVFGF